MQLFQKHTLPKLLFSFSYLSLVLGSTVGCGDESCAIGLRKLIRETLDRRKAGSGVARCRIGGLSRVIHDYAYILFSIHVKKLKGVKGLIIIVKIVSFIVLNYMYKNLLIICIIIVQYVLCRGIFIR